MARPQRDEIETAGSDSFLDVMANIVGILIILVMVVGTRAKGPVAPVAPAPPEVDEELDHQAAALDETARSLEGEVLNLARQAQGIERESAVRRAARGRMALAAELARRELDERKAKLDERRRSAFEEQQKAAAATARLSDLQRQLDHALRVKPDSIKLQSYPTPIARTVHGKEAHFQIHSGRIAYVPIEELIDELRDRAQDLVSRLRDTPEVSGTVGPNGGFRMLYTFGRVDVPVEVADNGARRTLIGGGSYAQLVEFSMIAARADLGETLRDALEPNSDFRARITSLPAARTTVTLWVYPDSFHEFRELRQELYRLGYQVAARPLPPGTPISGSPHGSKSASQ